MTITELKVLDALKNRRTAEKTLRVLLEGARLTRPGAECPICLTESTECFRPQYATGGATFRCFVCGGSGDLIDLVATSHELSRDQAVDWLVGFLDLNDEQGQV